jgi:hypothetical protein
MTELEQAKSYLRSTQETLAAARRVYHSDPDIIAEAESFVLAALDDLWTAQERSGYNAAREIEPFRFVFPKFVGEKS